MISCKELAKVFSESDHVSTQSKPFFERVEIKAHLLICENCRNYVKQLRLIASHLKQSLNDSSEISEAEISELVDTVKKKVVG